MALLLDKSYLNLHMIIATGSNKKLYYWLIRRSSRFTKKTLVLPCANNIDELMEAAEVIITKPGGITTAEALAKGVPMLIVHPLPGQEAMNTKFLLNEGVAVKAENPQDAVTLLSELLYNKVKLQRMGLTAKRLSKPASSIDIAKLLLQLVGT